MIARQLCIRQSRQLFRQTRTLGRLYSTHTPVDTVVQTSVNEAEDNPLEALTSSNLEYARAVAIDAWQREQAQKRRFRRTGGTVTDVYRPSELLRRSPNPSEITLEMLLASQTHFGHSTSRWNPQNSRYIYGIRDGIHIISLDQTAAYLRRASKVVEEVTARGGLVLFVGTREGQKNIVVTAAKLCRGYHIFSRWVPGSLSNGQQILGKCEMKIVNAMDEELPQWAPRVEGHAALKPDLVICLNPVENEAMLHECGLHNVPTIGIIDTDADPTRVTYAIPANDDSLRSVGVIAGALGRAGKYGLNRRLNAARQGQFTYHAVNHSDFGMRSEEFMQQVRGVADGQTKQIGEMDHVIATNNPGDLPGQQNPEISKQVEEADSAASQEPADSQHLPTGSAGNAPASQELSAQTESAMPTEGASQQTLEPVIQEQGAQSAREQEAQAPVSQALDAQTGSANPTESVSQTEETAQEGPDPAKRQ